MDLVFNKIKDRKRRLDSRKYFLTILKLIRFIFAIADILSDIYYISTAKFYNDIVYYLSITSLCALPLSLYIIGFITLYKKSPKNQRLIRELQIIFLWTIFGPILCCFYPLTILLEICLPKGYRNLGKFIALEYFYEALPQLCIQVLNNNSNNSWTISAIISCTLSSISLTLGLFQLSRIKFSQEYSLLLKQIEKSAVSNVKSKYYKDFEIKIDFDNNDLDSKLMDAESAEISKVREEEQVKERDENKCSSKIDISEDLIKLKFYELFEINELVLNMDYDLILDYNLNEEDHNFIDTCLRKEYEDYANSLELRKTSFRSRCCTILGFYISAKMILVFTVLTFSIAYIIFAKFKYEFKRFLLIFLMGWYYKHSISNIQKLEKQIPINYLPFFRIFIHSDFYNLVFLLYNIEPKIKNPIRNDIINFPYFWFFFISFQIWNYADASNDSNWHIAAIVLSLCYFILPIIRILLLFAKKFSKFIYF